MTHIHGHGNGFGHAQFCGSPRSIMEGLAFQFARAVIAEFFRPLNAGPFAFPCTPSAWTVRCGAPTGFPPKGGWCVMPEPKAHWTAQSTGTNTAKIDLGDGNRLEIDERSSQITIINDNTGERTRIWGDPHVEIDGKHAYDFWGTTTFTLENGTKITINTEQWGGNPNAYVASQVVITKGSNALVIDGVSQNKLGDLSMTVSNNGYAVDAVTRDGYTLHENACGGGWRTEAGNVATQDDLMATAVGREYGPGSELPSLGEVSTYLGSYLLLGTLIGFSLASSVSQRAEPETFRREDRHEGRNEARLHNRHQHLV